MVIKSIPDFFSSEILSVTNPASANPLSMSWVWLGKGCPPSLPRKPSKASMLWKLLVVALIDSPGSNLTSSKDLKSYILNKSVT